MNHGWIGVDLDGTLAHHDSFVGWDVIGEPIPSMMARVREWVDKRQRVKIFTARASTTVGVAHVRKWLIKHGLGDLETTNAKDMDMIAMWDDRAITVERNTGKILTAEPFQYGVYE